MWYQCWSPPLAHCSPVRCFHLDAIYIALFVIPSLALTFEHVTLTFVAFRAASPKVFALAIAYFIVGLYLFYQNHVKELQSLYSTSLHCCEFNIYTNTSK